jgi:predicted metal-dependent hydrolase
MVCQIQLNDQIISYNLKTSRQSRCLRVFVYRDCRLVVTGPRSLTEKFAGKFLLSKADWIIAKLEYFKSLPDVKVKSDVKEYRQNKKAALHLVRRLLAEYNQFYNYKIGNIRVKNQSTRWGSCSRQGNLNFSYRLALLPEELTRYIVVHELCHLKELNHSSNFWQLVAQTIPDYLIKRRCLKLVNLV